MENRIEEFLYEFEKLMMVLPMSDSFWKDAAIPTARIAEMFWTNMVNAILTWETAKRKLLDYQWPATWQDAFKERWFPGWARRRWPVRYRRIEVSELAPIKRGPEDKVRYFIEVKTPPN